MAAVDAPPHCEASAVERVKVSVRAQTFLDVLQGAFQSTWERPEVLAQAVLEVSATEEAKAGLRCLLSYLEALSPCLSRLCGVGRQEDEASAARQAKGRRKRRKRGRGGIAVGDVSEASVEEEEANPEHGLNPAALGQGDKMDTDAGRGQAGMLRGGEARLTVSEGGVGVVRGVRRAGGPPSHSTIANRLPESSVQGVLMDGNLLGCVLSFVGGEMGRQSVRALGQAALVCRKWREVSAWDCVWVGVEEKVVPALWGEERGGRRVKGRGRLMQYGRTLLVERRIWSEHDWTVGLELHVEVFDRMDGLQMMSARGPLVCKVEEANGRSRLQLPAIPALDVGGSSFSVASRDPEQRRFANIGAYIEEGHRSEYPCSLCVRVTVRDQRTGKGGLLWEEDKSTDRRYLEPIHFWHNLLPEGARSVVSKKSRMVGGGSDGLQGYTNLYIFPEPDQEGVPEEDRLYRVATGWDNSERRSHPFRLMLSTTDKARIGSLIRSCVIGN